MFNRKQRSSIMLPSDLFKLNPVSQFRIQESVQHKKKNKGVKKTNSFRQVEWNEFQKDSKNFQTSSNVYIQQRSMDQVNSTIGSSNKFGMNKKQSKSIKQSIENARVTNFYFRKLMATQYLCVLLTLLSFFINLVYTQADDEKQLNLVLIATTFMTATLIGFIIVRYYYQLELLKQQKVLKYSGSFATKLYKTGSLYPMLIEILIIIVHPNVLVTDVEIIQLQAFSLHTIQHQTNDMLALFLLLRVYIILRGMVSYTIFYSPRASRLCRIHLCDHNLMFSVKCILKEYPLRALITLFVLLLFVFGHGIKLTQSPLKLVEDPVVMDFTSYLNCFWCIIVTMGTLGYGDYYPRTIPGRVVIFLTSICGVLLSSLLIVALSAYLNMSTEEHKAHICIKRLKLQGILSKQASKAVLSVVKLGQGSKGTADNLDSQKQKKKFQSIYQQLKQHTNNVKSKMRQIKSLVDNNNLYQQMQRYFTILKNNFNQIFKRQRTLKNQLTQIANISSYEELDVIGFAKTLEQKALEK